MAISIKRVYEQPVPADGLRILVDRLWPRGLSKDKAKVDVWLKSIAPSSELRTWFHHDVDKWPEFKARYFAELDGNAEAVEELLDYARENKVILLYGAKDPRHNHAAALLEYLRRRLSARN